MRPPSRVADPATDEVTTKRSPARQPCRVAILPACLFVCALQGCAGSPAAPDPVSRSAATPTTATTASPVNATASTSAAAVTFQLLNGTFHLVGQSGSIDGTYTGEASVGRIETSTIELLVTGGSGALSGAAGTLSGTGKGAFTGEGPFSLTVAGRLTTSSASALQLRVVVNGTSTLSCTASGFISVTQNGTGSGPKVGSVTAAFQHQVSNTGCTG